MLSCGLAALWLFSPLVLRQLPVSTALSYTSIPHNVTQDSGKGASFLCGVSPETASTRVHFTIHRRHDNHSVLCPGDPMSLPSEVLKIPFITFWKGLNGYCEVKGQELRALWTIAYSSRRDSDTYVVCEPTGLSPAYAYLTVKVNDSYFTALIGCVVGGFVGTLLIFGLAYVGMRRSESCRRCFKGRTTPDDLSTIIED